MRYFVKPVLSFVAPRFEGSSREFLSGRVFASRACDETSLRLEMRLTWKQNDLHLDLAFSQVSIAYERLTRMQNHEAHAHVC
eukprot:scaffold2201_cov162-Skeletonema_marinoi.AAC.8